MTTVINTNVPAIIAKSNMDRVQRELENSISKLSSGSRINKAADDAAAEKSRCGQLYSNGRDHAVWLLTICVCLHALWHRKVSSSPCKCGFFSQVVHRSPDA